MLTVSFRKRLMSAIGIGLLSAGAVVASTDRASAVSFGTSWDRDCVGGRGAGSCSLQNLLDSQGIKVDTTKPTPISLFQRGRITGEVLFSVASFAPRNIFGIYDATTGQQTVLTNGTPNSKNALKTFKPSKNQPLPTLTFSMMANNLFGFFLTTPQNSTFYSQNSLNPNGATQFLAYELSSSTARRRDYIIAFEDLLVRRNRNGSLNGTDADYNDLVARVSIEQVPEPAAVLGLGAVAGMAALSRRKKKEAMG